MKRAAIVGIALFFVASLPAWAARTLDLKAELQAIRGDPAYVVDLNRALIIGSLVKRWGQEFASVSMAPADASDVLSKASAHQLYRAALAASFDELLSAVNDSSNSKGLGETKAVGDAGSDVSYTPVTPCRLIDTRGTFPAVYAGGAFVANEVRTYTIQGGNGVCLTQLPAGLNPAAVQMQVFGIPTTAASGDIEILPQGSTFGSTATMVYVGSIPFNTVSTNAKVNLANNEISIQVRGGGAHLAIDVVGYFRAPTLAPITNHVLTASGLVPTDFSTTLGTIGGCLPSEFTISGSCIASSAFVFLNGSYLNGTAGWSCDYNNQSALTQVVSVQAQCISIPASAVP